MDIDIKHGNTLKISQLSVEKKVQRNELLMLCESQRSTCETELVESQNELQSERSELEG